MYGAIYLAGPITGLSHKDSTDWRQYVINNLPHGISGFSPLRAKDYLKGSEALQHTYEDFPLSGQRGIYARDKYDCERCDILLVNLMGAETVSIGTVMEIAWASGVGAPIVLVMEKEGNLHDHPMIREACPFIVQDLDTAIDVIGAILIPSSH